ncbi:16S rRNA (cytosine967-C5)-methyltransferase [Hydrogenoanaerobacterium saccharovorans]|uniref:16S rRNA (cytosine(967)-C(5))-methyltransferase n=1 Tax=Hydrogenoanaerobacterium saccharovorans TaxID=474960 RepID=A0A1H8D6G7_9FIRM|nr:16S rRNA (cytosine(967)-C(5))-methyltransferase RsmB [Hydrogenoanaerobacterium saccharovorans]RPF43489.1 16S rRNA (cytosine967-C5)-methyltransferase [Hydrogenoanaerobacterium saccharovorans]SEN02228.1 16S rRNA (cytosine967-C5)-methyltransferase [Hydrogenoanaerobacterium saccharovorans]
MKSARQVAVQALVKVNQDGGYSNLVIDSELSKSELDPRDKAFCTTLFYGVLERRITLDAVLQKYCKQPLKKLMPQVRELLHIAVYQILYMSSVPTSAAVNESVELSRKMKCGHASGFINGVLRSFLRDGGSLDGILPNKAAKPVPYLSLFYSVPEWLAEHWIKDYGAQTAESILAAAADRPPLYLRVNCLKNNPQDLAEALRKKGMEVTIREEIGNCLEVEKTGEIDYPVLYKRGHFTVQDISSQLCVQAADAKPGMRCLDVCAAPGGKSFTLAQMMEDKGELLSLDLHEFKTKLIKDGAKRLGLHCIQTAAGDAQIFDETRGEFDRVLCDVPCSGLGIIRRKPEIRYKNPDDLKGLPQIQYKILETSSKYVKEGGKLVYSTCTLSRAENDEVVQRFLAEHPEFCPEPLPNPIQKLTGANGDYKVTLLPEMLNSDGFFIATLKRVRNGECL